jgi:hypothetical protein
MWYGGLANDGLQIILDHPALFAVFFRPVVDLAGAGVEAACLVTAMLAGPWAERMRARSSRNTTSSIQCTLLSMPQWPRVALAKVSTSNVVEH